MRAKDFENSKEDFVEMFRKFLPLAMKVIGLKSLPKMIFEKSVDSPDQPTFGQYINSENTLYVGIANRHPNDILRTVAHELVHYKQDTEHKLNGQSGETGSPEENEANAVAGVVMRNFNKLYPQYLEIKPIVREGWSEKYKRSINCSNPKGFSQRAHCQGRKKNENLNRDDMFYGGDNDPDGPRTRQDYRVTDKIDFEGLPASLIYRIRADAMRIPSGIKGLAATEKFYNKYKKYLKPHHAADIKKESAGDRGDIPTGPIPQLIPFPQGTSMVDVSDAYDWYKLGMVISDLDDADPNIFGKGAPNTIIAFGSEEEENKMLPLLKRLGLKIHDIDRPEDVKQAIPAKMFVKDIAETIRKVKGGYRLVSKKGRNLGTYPSKAGAEKRERQVQYFKHVGVAEGKIINTYLWHGSRNKISILEPRQAVDTGGAAGSNQNAIYATSDPNIAIAMGLTTAGSDTGMFPNDPQMVLFSGDIRKGKYVYLHKLPMNGPDGKPQFVQGGNSREFHSVPGVKQIKPIEIKEVPVNKYLNLIRKATKQDWALRKKYMKNEGVAENFADGRNPQDKGDSARHGIRKGMTIAQLKKIRSSKTASPRKKQLAHWQINMRQGRSK